MSAPPYIVDWCNILLEREFEETATPIIVTKLHADGMPMLRYRIGDLGRFPSTTRPAQPVFEIDEILGREVDRIWLPRGGWLHSATFPHMLKDMCTRDFQVYQAPDFSLEIRIVPDAGFGEAISEAILRTVLANVGGSLPVRIRLVESIARTAANKWRPVLSDAGPAEPVARIST
jgi:phenylacetate-coenzyme A ligase PaaK-like adenylate-forming protein